MLDNTEEFELYVRGRDYNNKLSPPYYPTISRNWEFYGGDQWKGVKSNGLSTPQLNVTKQIIDYKIAAMCSTRTKMQFSVENIPDDTEDAAEQELQHSANLISGYVDQKWEKLKMDSQLREVLLDGAISGDMCFYTYWDPTIDTRSYYGKRADGKAQKVMGDFVTETVDGSNVMFGNPASSKVQSQPYILIAGRKSISELKAEAKRNKRPQDEIDSISADDETNEQLGDRGKIELDAKSDASKCLYLIKLWKERSVAPLANPDTVYMKKVTRAAVIQGKTDTGLTLYPIAWANWDIMKNSYHGSPEVSGIIPNQILINQLFAMMAYYMRMSAFGKVVYDRSRIASWNNAIGAAIPVEGDISNAVQQLQPGQMNNFVMTLVEKAITYTKEIAGVNDAALGNMSPRNTSAIMALQKQASIPLESIKDRMYQLVEDLGLIWLDFIVNKYEVERKVSYTQNNKTMVGSFTGSNFKEVPFKIKIDVGAASYWSEMANINTLDNLLEKEKLSLIQYLERLPNGVMDKKGELIREKQAEQQNKQPEPDLPKFSINYQDMPTTAQLQLLAKAGIEVQPQDMPQVQSEELQQQTAQAQQATNQLQWEKMAQFEETLAPEVQQKLREMPDAQHEAYLMELMKQPQQNM